MPLDKISLHSTAIARILATIASLLILASMAGQFSRFVLGHGYLKGLVPLFYIEGEHNIPAYFSMLLMLFAALLLAGIALLSWQRSAPHVSKWWTLSFGFVFMAFDEAFQVHEKLVSPVRALLGQDNLGILFYAWVIPGLALAVFLALYFLEFLLYLPVTARLRFVAAGTLFLGGAIGFELIGGRYAEVHGAENWTYSMIATVEEGLEMAGVIVFIQALLKYYADNFKEVLCRFEG